MLFLLTFALLSQAFQWRAWTARSCMPRVAWTTGKPIFWNLFGQSGGDKGSGENKDEDDESVDAETLKRAEWTTSDWIRNHNYELEVHNVTTTDGYNLQIHRIPNPKYRPVLLIHGLMMSSLSWVFMGPNKSLAFELFNKNYDVWLGNFRGSPYARSHQIYNTSESDFWNFSFHEIGVYDLPALIDYIRNETVFHQVILIGHSQAFNAFLVLCSLLPEYNDRILLMQALAPTVELHNNVKFSTEDVRKLMKLVKKRTQAKIYEMAPPGALKEQCLKSSVEKRRSCLSNIRLLAGEGAQTKAINTILFSSVLQGGALKEIQHLHQLWKSGDFVAFDYDPEDNRIHYNNSVEPLNYNLSQVTVPIVLHFGNTDAIATLSGVHRIYSRRLPDAYVMGVYRVAAPVFNHLDFLCSTDVKTLVNDKVIDIIKKYFAGTLQYVIE